MKEDLKIKSRPEVHTRTTFANDRAEYWFAKAIHCTEQNGGNILSCKPMIKIAQARRIYIHYCNEFQRNQNIPLTRP